MARVAALFPGQGSQTVGMGRDLDERWSEAAAVFREVDEALGHSISDLCWNGTEDDLRLTENTQPALLCHSIAAWRVLEKRGVRVDAVAGHSLGEYSAVVASGGLSLADAARTVRLRGQLMQRAVPVGQGAMAAVLGLDDDAVRAVCAEESKETGEVVEAVNFNAPGQVVVAGHASAVNRAAARLKQAGARRVMPLPVSAPFHSSLMAPAREGLEPTLRSLSFGDLSAPLYRNVDATPVRSGGDVCEGLVQQVDRPVLWSTIIRNLLGEGFDTFVEVGTGSVLSGLVRRIDRGVTSYSAGTVDGVEAAAAVLAGEGGNDAR